jgi:hypothetical protein
MGSVNARIGTLPPIHASGPRRSRRTVVIDRTFDVATIKPAALDALPQQRRDDAPEQPVYPRHAPLLNSQPIRRIRCSLTFH